MQFEPALFSCCAARRLVGIPAIPRADRRVVGGSAYDCASSWASRTHCSDMPRRHDRGKPFSPRVAYAIGERGSSIAPLPEEGHIKCGLGHGEATAILSWGYAEVLCEKAPHRTHVTEPGSRTDVLDWEIGLLEQSPRLVDSDATHEVCRRLVEVRPAPAAERTRTHSGGIRETLNRQRLVEVLKDERVDVVELGRDPSLAAKCGAELRLTT